MAGKKKAAATAAPSTELLNVSVPMPSADMGPQANAFLTSAQALVVATPQDYEDAAQALKLINSRDNELEALRKSLVAPINTAKQRIQDLFNPPLLTLERARNIIKGKMGSWYQQEEAKRRAAQAKIEEDRRKEQARLQKLADDAAAKGKIEKAQQLEIRSQSLVTPTLVSEVPKLAGVAMRDNWQYEIVDASLLPREYLSPDLSAISKVVKALKGNTNIPGVRAYNDPRPAVGSG